MVSALLYQPGKVCGSAPAPASNCSTRPPGSAATASSPRPRPGGTATTRQRAGGMARGRVWCGAASGLLPHRSRQADHLEDGARRCRPSRLHLRPQRPVLDRRRARACIRLDVDAPPLLRVWPAEAQPDDAPVRADHHRRQGRGSGSRSGTRACCARPGHRRGRTHQLRPRTARQPARAKPHHPDGRPLRPALAGRRSARHRHHDPDGAPFEYWPTSQPRPQPHRHQQHPQPAPRRRTAAVALGSRRTTRLLRYDLARTEASTTCTAGCRPAEAARSSRVLGDRGRRRRATLWVSSNRGLFRLDPAARPAPSATRAGARGGARTAIPTCAR